jgi:hypothetical protein
VNFTYSVRCKVLVGADFNFLFIHIISVHVCVFVLYFLLSRPSWSVVLNPWILIFTCVFFDML